jgi:lysozyme family protein
MFTRRTALRASAFAGAYLARNDNLFAQRASPLAQSWDRNRREFNNVYASAANILGPFPTAVGQARGPLDLAEIVLKAGSLLSDITRDERDVRLFEGDTTPEVAAYPYILLKPQYIGFVKACQIVSGQGELARAAAFVYSDSAKQRYSEASAASQKKVPWFIIGALHYREANLNFMGHLHNGDPLLAKTYHVPAGRPKGKWPPSDSQGNVITDRRQLWTLSAVDSLNSMAVPNVGWTAAGTCWALEAYNGFGFRSHGVNSPYLWNYTQYYNHAPYAAGGFYMDGPDGWRSSYVSKQAGLIALLKQVLASDQEFRWDFSS